MLIEALILAVIYGLLSRGSIMRLANIRLKFLSLFFVSIIIRYIPALLNLQIFQRHSQLQETLAPIFFIISYLILITALLLNFHIPSLRFVLAGTLMNFAVVTANGGYMPVSRSGLFAGDFSDVPLPGEMLDMNHIVAPANVRLAFLGDIFLVPPPYPFPQLFSIGDIFICIGVFLLVFKTMTRENSDS